VKRRSLEPFDEVSKHLGLMVKLLYKIQLCAGAKSDVQKLVILCVMVSIESFRYIRRD